MSSHYKVLVVIEGYSPWSKQNVGVNSSVNIITTRHDVETFERKKRYWYTEIRLRSQEVEHLEKENTEKFENSEPR